jgi:hypothetical protein
MNIINVHTQCGLSTLSSSEIHKVYCAQLARKRILGYSRYQQLYWMQVASKSRARAEA